MDYRIVPQHDRLLPDDDCRVLEALIFVLSDIQDTLGKPGMTVRELRILLEVGCSDGTYSVSDIAERVGCAPSVASRALSDLGRRIRTGEPGLGLIEPRLSSIDLKRHVQSPTPKGIATLRRWARMLRHSVHAKP